MACIKHVVTWIAKKKTGNFEHNTTESGQIIATWAEVTPNGGLVGESAKNEGIIVICPDRILLGQWLNFKLFFELHI